MTRDAAELHRGLFGAIVARDYDDLRALFASDAVHVSGEGDATIGPESVVEEVQGFVTAFPDLSIDIEHQHVVGPSRSIVEYTFRGTHDGPLDDVATTGEVIPVRACSVVEAHDGFIRRESDYYNTLDMLTQLGASAR